MLSKALREYDTVSVEPIATRTDGARAVLFENGARRAGIDVRRFPWIRPLSGEYAYNFSRVAPLYAGDPASPEAWREVIGRVQGHARNQDAIAAGDRRAAGATQRAAGRA
jgi:hypothetical protein